MIQLRQGDVFIKCCKQPRQTLAPVNRDARGRLILAAGEATGHHHAIEAREAALFNDDKGKCFLYIDGNPVMLGHEEHAPITIDPGWYEVIRQREYTPEAIRNVTD